MLMMLAMVDDNEDKVVYLTMRTSPYGGHGWFEIRQKTVREYGIWIESCDIRFVVVVHILLSDCLR